MVITFANGNQLLFTYDAAGTKLIKAKSTYYPGYGNVINGDRYYVGGVEYLNSSNGTVPHPELALIDIIQNAEGFAKRDVSGSYSDNYILRDHLGNTIVVFSDKNNDGFVDATDIVQVNAYYPFGLNHGANVNGAAGSFKYQYNGKELNDDFGLNWNDYGARWYDPAIGRWHATDPLAEMYVDQSPYHYVMNNPVKNIDPDGMHFEIGDLGCHCGNGSEGSGDGGGTETGGGSAFQIGVEKTMGGGNIPSHSGSGGASPNDWVRGSNGDIRWDNTASSPTTTQKGDVYLGETLEIKFNSYIDKDLWDGPNSPIGKTWGDKLTSTIYFTGKKDKFGNLVSISSRIVTQAGITPMGTPSDYYPGLGSDQNKFSLIASGGSYNLNYEHHLSVSTREALGLHLLGYYIVNVAQKVDINVSPTGKLTLTAATDIFPSATLYLNGNTIMQYNQPSFLKNFKMPFNGFSNPSPGIIMPKQDLSFPPAKWFKRF